MEIGGVKVDINPITEGKTGTISKQVRLIEKYLDEKSSVIERLKHAKENSHTTKEKNSTKSKNHER